MNLTPVKQYADVVNGVIHVHLPEGFNAIEEKRRHFQQWK